MVIDRTRRQFVLAATGLVGFAALPAFAQDKPPLKMAVHPYASTLSLIATHQPLRQHIAAVLGRQVEFYTAANFDAFVTALMAGEYDIAISPPHFAVLAMERSYVPLMRYRMAIEPLLIVRTESPYWQAADFRGKTIAMADKSAFIRLAMIKWLADNGLKAGRDYKILERPTHSASVTAASMGEADAGLATLNAVMQMPLDVQQQMRSLSPGLRLPHLFTLAHRRLGEREVQRLRTALAAFQNLPEGREFMDKVGYLGYEEITRADIQQLAPYIELYRQMTGER